MLTIFAIPKALVGHFGVIQRNAITSWSLLRPKPEIILFGHEQGTAEIADELGLRHVPEVETNEFGTPLLSDLFEKTTHLARHDLLCFINSDIILMSDFIMAVQELLGTTRQFMMTSRRWNLEVTNYLDFNKDWEGRLQSLTKDHAWLSPPIGADYFLFPRGKLAQIPPFAIGRNWWDRWLLYQSRRCGLLLVDATEKVMVVHQNHDYSHHPHGEIGVHGGAEASHNMRLAGYIGGLFRLKTATGRLTDQGLKKKTIDIGHLDAMIQTGCWHYYRLLYYLLDVTRPVRHSLGLRYLRSQDGT